MSKKQITGIVEKEKKEADGLRFYKVEYLHPHLNLTKMFDMFVEEYRSRNITTGYETYGKVFGSLNLSFHHPKKDVCGRVTMKKAELQEEYTCHIKEKVEARRKKELAKFNPQDCTAALTFDLQQCDCFLWHEGLGKRGASEISTCLYLQLKVLDAPGIEEVILFADGCSGQNKNCCSFNAASYVGCAPPPAEGFPLPPSTPLAAAASCRLCCCCKNLAAAGNPCRSNPGGATIAVAAPTAPAGTPGSKILQVPLHPMASAYLEYVVPLPENWTSSWPRRESDDEGDPAGVAGGGLLRLKCPSDKETVICTHIVMCDPRILFPALSNGDEY
nr:unnamed protein product [Callosobruchus analis]